MAAQTNAELAAEIRSGSMEDRAWMIDALDRAAAALEAMAILSRSAEPTCENDRHVLESAVGAVLFNASNHPNPTAVLGKDVAPLRSKIVNAILVAGFGRVGQATEWGTQHPDGPIHPWRDYREAHWRERVLGEPLVRRQISAWRPVVSGVDRG